MGERRVGDDVRSTAPRRWRIRSLDNRALANALAALQVSGIQVAAGGVDVLVDSDEAVADLIASLVGRGIRVVSCAPLESSLEASYFELTAPE